MKAFFCIFLIALSLGVSHVGHAAPISWTTGTTGDASGAWSGSATTFNGQSYTAADDLFIDGSATKTITLTGTIMTPLSLTITGTGTTGNTITSNAGVPGAGAITLTGSSIGGTLSKTGNTDLVLASANAFGAVSISSGKFFLNNAAGLGTTGTLSVNAGAANGVSGSYAAGTMGSSFYDSSNINASYAFSKDITFGTVGSATTYGMAMRGGQSRTTTLSGNITGAANITLWFDTSTSGDGTSIWSLTGDNSAFAGNYYLNRGRLSLGNANAAGTGAITIGTNSNTAGNLVLNFSGTLNNNITIATSGNSIGVTGTNSVTLASTSTLTTNTGVNWAKAGTGTLTLAGNVAGTGRTTVFAGTLNLDYSANSSSKLGGALTLAGGTLNLSGGSTVQAAAGTTFDPGASAINQIGGTSTLTLGAITRNAGSTLELGAGGIATTSSTLGGASSLATTTTGGVLGVVGGNDWIARNATTGLVGYSTVGSYTPTTATTISGNADVAAGITATTLATGGTATTIRFDQNQATTITNTTGTLSVSQGGILVTSAVGNNASTITGGTLASGTNNSLLIFQNNTAGGMTISSIIADRSQTGNTSYTSGTLVKSGAGTLTLGAVNTYSGQTYLNGGTTVIAAGSGIGGANGTFASLTSLTSSASVTYTGSLPTGLGIGTAILGSTITAINDSTKTITLAANAGTALTGGTASWANAQALNLNGGTLQTTATFSMTESNNGGTAGTTTVNRAVVLGGNGGTFNTNPSTTLTVAGVISGGGSLTKSGTGTLTLSGANTFNGGTTINAGMVTISTSSALGTGMVNANSSYNTTYTSGGTPFLRTTVSGLTIANDIALSSTAGYYALQMGAATGGSVTWSGLISGGLAGTGTGTYTGTVLQIDTPNGGDSTSSATLSGNNTFVGQLRLNRGTLTLTNSSAAGAADILIQSNSNANGNLIFSNSFTLANAITITTANNAISTGANDVTLSGKVTSGVAWTKTGAGTLTLTANMSGVTNDISGATTITNGTLVIGGASRFDDTTYNGAITLTAATSVLDYASSLGNNLAGVISGLGSFRKTGSAAITLSGNSTFSGGTTLTAGTLRVSTNDTALGTGTITVTSNTVDASASPTLATANGGGARVLANNIAITNNGTGITTLNLDGGFATLTLNGEISGTGGLATTSIGTVVLGGTNTYTGTTTVNSSLLRLDSAGALPGGVATAGGISALLFNGSGADGGVVGLTAATGDFTRSIGGTTPTAAQVGWSNGGTGGFAAFGGDRTVNFGGAAASQTWSNSGGVFGGGLILSHSTADSTVTVVNPIVLNITGARTVTVNDGSATVDAILSGVLSTGASAFTKAGAGTLALTAANTYGSTYTTGTTFTTISAGTLQLGNGGTTGSLTSTGTGDIQNNGTLAINRSNAVSLAYVIKGTGAVTQLGAGTTTLTAANTYSGTTTVTNGTLALTSTGRTGTGAVTVQTGGTVLGTGLLRGSTFTALSGSTVHAGNGTAQGDYGTLTFTPASGSGSFDFQSGSSVILGINPGGAGDLLSFNGLLNGTLLFNGGLQVTADGYVPMSTETFNLLDWSNLSTVTFASRYSAGSYAGFLLGDGDDNLGFDLPNIAGSGYGWDISQFITNGTISTVVIVPEPARASLLLAGLCSLLIRRRRSL